MSLRVANLVIVLAALMGLAGVVVWAPDYLTAQGFPLDDAWIHAVYGRALARSGMLAYNPGVPATGTTAPLWSVVVALPHLFGADLDAVRWVKLVGFLFHALTAVVLFAALRGEAGTHDGWALAGAVLVAIHPDLVSASVSGMEVPFAALAAVSLLYTIRHGRAVAYAAVAAVAFLIRPELAVVSVVLPLACNAVRRARAVVMTGAGALGTAVSLLLLAGRNWAVSGLALPATFHAKVGNGPPLYDALHMGFVGLLGEIPPVNSILLLAAALGLSAVLLRASEPALRIAAAGFVSGVAYCAVSFVLIAAVDPAAFYHQRYVLPAVPLLVGPLPLVLAEALRRALPARPARAIATLIAIVLLAVLVRDAPQRFAHLANDARNIDDVQVAVGRHLSAAAPSEVVWAVDAGAVRYFGNAFVVDMLGLNTPELLDARAQAFLDAHPPRWIEVVPTWSALSGGQSAEFPRFVFEPRSPYTVTTFPAMQRHLLVRCASSQAPARFSARTGVFAVVCAARADLQAEDRGRRDDSGAAS
jgi:hypothetical protein